jgi:hypothetical protein
MARQNTKPSTPFGHFFNAIGLWKPNFEKSIVKIYEQLQDSERKAIEMASGWVAVVNTNLQATPDFVFDIIQQKFPGVSKEKIAEVFNKVNKALKLVDDNTPETFEDAVAVLQAYLSKFGEHAVWASATKMVVEIAANILTGKATPIQTISTVLEYVYQMFIKPKMDKAA